MIHKSKQNVFVALRSTWHLRDFVQSGAVDELEKHFNVEFVSLDYRLSGGGREFDEAVQHRKSHIIGRKIGESIFRRFLFLIRTEFSHFAYFLNQVHSASKVFKTKTAIEKTAGIDGPHFIPFLWFFNFFRISKFLSNVIKFFLQITNHSEFKNLPRVDCILVAYNSYNINGFCDDIIRFAKKQKIPTFGIQLNWDNIINRYPLELPDYLGVYGEQTFVHAVSHHRIQPSRIFPLGSLRFDIFRKKRRSRNIVRKELGIPLDKRVLLYCPSSRAFDEQFIITHLEKAINQGDLPSDLHIYYKGHTGKNEILQNKNSALSLPEDFKNVTFWEPGPDINKGADLSFYNDIYGAVDAVISPFSTMLLEGNICGLPGLAFSYNPRKYGIQTLKDWDVLRFALHLYGIRNSSSNIICNSREDITLSIRLLLERIKMKNISIEARVSAGSSVYLGLESAAERLVKFTELVIEKKERDESYYFYKKYW